MKMFVILILVVSIISNLPCFSQESEAGFKITVDPRIELMNIALTFTNLPFYGKISDENYQYYKDVINHFNVYKDHEAIRRCESLPYFRDVSFPEQVMLYMTDPPEMKLKYDPPANVPKQVVDEILETVDLLN